MRSRIARLLVAGLGVAVGLAALFVNEAPSSSGTLSLVSQAEAVVGRPRTPVSYAGVARRTTYRAVTTPHVYVAPVVVPAPVVVVAPRAGCYQAVNGYGQIYWRCP